MLQRGPQERLDNSNIASSLNKVIIIIALDGTPHFAASQKRGVTSGLFCLSMSHKKDARLKRVNTCMYAEMRPCMRKSVF